MVKGKKDCGIAVSGLRKKSDAVDIGAGAEIILALLRQQPVSRLELCKNAGIHPSTFARYKRLLTNRGILKEHNKKYSLWIYKEVPSLWDSLLEKLKNAGGHLIKVQIEETIRGEYNPITYDCEIHYEKFFAEGILILRGATKLEKALELYVPRSYTAFFVSPVLSRAETQLKWQNKTYQIREVEKFFDIETLSYTIAKLINYQGN
jgi:hypothetical protein